MKHVLDSAAKRVSCTFDAFVDDTVDDYEAIQPAEQRLVRKDAMVKQSTGKQWMVRITSDPVRPHPPTWSLASQGHFSALNRIRLCKRG